MKIFDIEISMFENYRSPDNPKTITLNTWFNSVKYKNHVLHIRETGDKEMKALLPAITPSGTFSRRAKECLLQHSGFIQFDIDGKENPDMDVDLWKPEIIKLGACMCQISVSGAGLWGLFRIQDPTLHEQHFNAMMDIFASYGIQIDESCSDVSRLRGYSYDEDTLFNPDASVFTFISDKKKPKTQKIKTAPRNDIDTFQLCMNRIIADRIDMTVGYQNWFALGCSIESEFGEAGRQQFHILSQFHPDYNHQKTDEQYDAIRKSNGTGYTLATFYKKCDEFGIRYAEKKSEVDKYCRMAAKNPVLKKLVDTFDLVDKDGNLLECEAFSNN